LESAAPPARKRCEPSFNGSGRELRDHGGKRGRAGLARRSLRGGPLPGSFPDPIKPPIHGRNPDRKLRSRKRGFGGDRLLVRDHGGCVLPRRGGAPSSAASSAPSSAPNSTASSASSSASNSTASSSPNSSFGTNGFAANRAPAPVGDFSRGSPGRSEPRRASRPPWGAVPQPSSGDSPKGYENKGV
jgi:hypothetical protein